MADNVSLTREDGVATIAVDRPDRRNILNLETRDELKEAFGVASDDDEVRAIVLRGAGDEHYLGGAEIEEFVEFDLLDGLEYVTEYGQGTYNYVADVRTPTIAAIDGNAFGGALEISLACDIRVATPDAKLGLTEVNFGLIPGGGGVPRLVSVVGTGVATEMVLRGRVLDASEAREVGLVTHVFDDESFDDEVRAIADDLAEKPPVAMRLAKDALDRSTDIEGALDFEGLACSFLFGTEDKQEGMEAFLEKRDAEFRGR